MKASWFFLLIISLTACTKSGDPCDPNDETSPCYGNPGGGDQLLLYEQKIDGKLVSQCTYDNQNRLIEMHTYTAQDGSTPTIVSYAYNSNGLITTVDYRLNGKHLLRDQYTYAAGGNKPASMTQTTPSQPDNVPVDWTFEYQEDRVVETATARHKDGVPITTTHTFDKKGNVLSLAIGSADQWVSTVEFSDYDNKHHVAKYANPFPWKNKSPNNPRSHKVTSPLATANLDRVYKYTYNDNGYPIKAELTDRATGNLVEVHTYSYIPAK